LTWAVNIFFRIDPFLSVTAAGPSGRSAADQAAGSSTGNGIPRPLRSLRRLHEGLYRQSSPFNLDGGSDGYCRR
jgi:hypothetical protein